MYTKTLINNNIVFNFNSFNDGDLEKVIDEILSILKNNNDKISYNEEVLVDFYTKADVYYGRKYKELEKVKLSFYKGDNYYGYKKGRGCYYLFGLEKSKIKSITLFRYSASEEANKQEKEKSNFFNRVKKRLFDDITWSNLNKDSFDSSNKYFYDIRKIFHSSDIDRLKEAFENKSNIFLRAYSPKRDYSIETKMGDDGVFRAWFSSEFSNCGNGSYYLLLNPTTAVHYEND